MKVVVAIDSLKGSLTSMEAGKAIRTGINRVDETIEVVTKPLADGGEGTTDALIEGLNGQRENVEVINPLGEEIVAYYGYLEASNTAVMEMASAAGIMLMENREMHPKRATTYGVGMMIKHAIKKGIRNFIIGIGGSATNDGGVGMLQALGYQFLDASGNVIPLGAEGLAYIETINDKYILSELKECYFKIACDVNNPLYGPNGATYIYGSQKGIAEDMKEPLDYAMQHYAKVTKHFIGKDYSKMPGAGAAGGLGFACISYLQSELIPGIDLILDVVRLEEDIQDADLVITGEGQLDHQTAMGKAPVGVAKMAKKYNKKVIAFAGSVTKDAKACNEAGIDAYFPIIRGITTLQEAMDSKQAKDNMSDTVEQVFRLIV